MWNVEFCDIEKKMWFSSFSHLNLFLQDGKMSNSGSAMAFIFLTAFSLILATPNIDESEKKLFDLLLHSASFVFNCLNQLFHFKGTGMRDLYDFLLQRELTEPIINPHEVERKSLQSPARAALRLRFGRADPIAAYRRVRVEIANNFQFVQFSQQNSSIIGFWRQNKAKKSFLKSASIRASKWSVIIVFVFSTSRGKSHLWRRESGWQESSTCTNCKIQIW